ncbi:thymidine kinase [Prevotella sp. AGR2160]|uniref:thymidine kinase n=1 Tax=Prevotella sp. AGR2160 TaxID=1280674 RepID=UPI00048F1854|nr:thymidine kinase [Prevotella sp. AGR2160]
MIEKWMGERRQFGRIEVICGSMFSGKTEELIRRLRRAKFAKQETGIFKPAIDTRYSKEDVVSHDHRSIPSVTVETSREILEKCADLDVVGIDEAQFLDKGLVSVCNRLANEGVRVIIAGLDMDYKGQPFGPIPALLAVADEVTKVHAICVRCGAQAYVSHRLVSDKTRVLLGEQQEYEPLCRKCYQEVLKENKHKEKNQDGTENHIG